MSALSRLELKRDLSTLNISLFSQCRALIREGHFQIVEQLLDKHRSDESIEVIQRIESLNQVAKRLHA